MLIQKFYVYDEINLKGCSPCKCYLEDATNWAFHFASFGNIEQAENFLKKFKVTLELFANYNNGVTVFKCSKVFKDGGYFWNINELPKNVKKIVALSNGSRVVCYYKMTSKEVIFYRPNPNAKNVYKPLSLKKHREYEKKYGIF